MSVSFRALVLAAATAFTAWQAPAAASRRADLLLANPLWELCDTTASPSPASAGSCYEVALQWRSCKEAGPRCSWFETGRLVALSQRLDHPSRFSIAAEARDMIVRHASTEGTSEILPGLPVYSLIVQSVAVSDPAQALLGPLSEWDRQIIGLAGGGRVTYVLLNAAAGDGLPLSCRLLQSPLLEKILGTQPGRSVIGGVALRELGSTDVSGSLCAVKLLQEHFARFGEQHHSAMLHWLSYELDRYAEDLSTTTSERLPVSTSSLNAIFAWPNANIDDGVVAATFKVLAALNSQGISATSFIEVIGKSGLLAYPEHVLMTSNLAVAEKVASISGGGAQPLMEVLTTDVFWPEIAGRMGAGEIWAMLDAFETLCVATPSVRVQLSLRLRVLERNPHVLRNSALRVRLATTCGISETHTASEHAIGQGLSDRHLTTLFALTKSPSVSREARTAFERFLMSDRNWELTAARHNLAVACALPAEMLRSFWTSDQSESGIDVWSSCSFFGSLSHGAQDAARGIREHTSDQGVGTHREVNP